MVILHLEMVILHSKKKKFLSKRNFLLFETLIIAKKYRNFSIGKMHEF